jgi:hypothetical protein
MSSHATLEDLALPVSQMNKLLSEMLSSSTPRAAATPTYTAVSPLIPPQRTRRTDEKRRVPPGITAVSRDRTWELLLETGRKRSRTVSDLTIALLAEGHSHVTPRNVATWLTHWELLGRIRCAANHPAPAYEVVDGGRDRTQVDQRLLVPSSSDDPVPLLLRAAFDEIRVSGKKWLHTRTLAAAAGIRSYEFGAHLGPLVRAAGVHRPTQKVREVPGGPLAPGYTEECLDQAVAAYEASAPKTVEVPSGQGL